LCWEHAAALRDNVLPAINNKLFFVGVGNAQAAAEFADKLDIDPSLCFGDEGGAAGDALELQKGFKTMWNPTAVKAMMDRNDQESLTELGNAFKEAADNIGIKQLMPKNMDDTLRQGGTFVFRGGKVLLEHYDGKVGDNCDIHAILAAVR